MDVNDSNFKEKVIEQSKKIPVVVDFWNEWCPPCLALAPIMEKLAKEYKGKFILAKAKTDEARKAAVSYSIEAIPNVKMFKNGKIISEFLGARPEIEVRNWLDKNL